MYRLMALLVTAALLVGTVASPLAHAATQEATAPAQPSTSTSSEDKAEKSGKSGSNEMATTTDKKSASKDVETSKVESEKLDPKLFDRDAQADSKEKDAGSTSGVMGRFVFGLIVVLAAIYGVHAILKRAARARGGIPSVAASSAVEVIASTPLAQGRVLHVVRLGDEVAVLGATDHSITRVGSLSPDALTQTSSGASGATFSSVLGGALGNPEPLANAVVTGLEGTAVAMTSTAGLHSSAGISSGAVRGGAAGAQDQSFWNRFVSNLQIMTSR
jgi:flagellar biogenesis protein FliO